MAVPPIIHAEHRIVRVLRDADALSPASARQLLDLGRLDERALARLVAAGCVAEAAPGRYWLDEGAYGAHRNRRRTRAMAVLAGALVLFALLVALGIITT